LRVCKKNTEIKLSFLKKKFDLATLISLLKSKIKNSEIINMENLEDYIIIGKKLKD